MNPKGEGMAPPHPGQDDAGDEHEGLAGPEKVEPPSVGEEESSVLPQGASVVGSLIAVGGPDSRDEPRGHDKNTAMGVESVSPNTETHDTDQSQHRRRDNCSNDGRGRRPKLGWFLHGMVRGQRRPASDERMTQVQAMRRGNQGRPGKIEAPRLETKGRQRTRQPTWLWGIQGICRRLAEV